jgi:hypothetical protein
VTWAHFYVTPDQKHTFCIYDAPTPEAARARADGLQQPPRALASDVVQRGERSRREELVTPTPEHAHIVLPRAEFT